MLGFRFSRTNQYNQTTRIQKRYRFLHVNDFTQKERLESQVNKKLTNPLFALAKYVLDDLLKQVTLNVIVKNKNNMINRCKHIE